MTTIDTTRVQRQLRSRILRSDRVTGPGSAATRPGRQSATTLPALGTARFARQFQPRRWSKPPVRGIFSLRYCVTGRAAKPDVYGGAISSWYGAAIRHRRRAVVVALRSDKLRGAGFRRVRDRGDRPGLRGSPRCAATPGESCRLRWLCDRRLFDAAGRPPRRRAVVALQPAALPAGTDQPIHCLSAGEA